MDKKDQRWVYIVLCSDETYYTWITNRLEERIAAHNTGVGAKYTRGRWPVCCVWKHTVESKSVASRYEYRIKKLSRSKKSQLIAGSFSIESLYVK